MPYYYDNDVAKYHTTKPWNEFIDLVKTIGVDWNKTEAPHNKFEQCFEGTEAESSDVEVLFGILYLLDGRTFHLASMPWLDKEPDVEVDYIHSIMKLMKNPTSSELF